MIDAIWNNGSTTFSYMYTHFASPSTVGCLILSSLCIYTFGVYRYGGSGLQGVPAVMASWGWTELGRSGGVRCMSCDVWSWGLVLSHWMGRYCLDLVGKACKPRMDLLYLDISTLPPLCLSLVLFMPSRQAVAFYLKPYLSIFVWGMNNKLLQPGARQSCSTTLLIL